jgi:hypothetical protein
MKKITYHYSNRDHPDGSVITAGYDSYQSLSKIEKVVEDAVRASLPNGQKIRSESLYSWESEDFVRRIWPHIPKKFVYELEIDTSDIQHQADLNYYNDAKDAACAGTAIDTLVAAYCSGQAKPGESPRIEILTTMAIVRRKILGR